MSSFQTTTLKRLKRSLVPLFIDSRCSSTNMKYGNRFFFWWRREVRVNWFYFKIRNVYFSGLFNIFITRRTTDNIILNYTIMCTRVYSSYHNDEILTLNTLQCAVQTYNGNFELWPTADYNTNFHHTIMNETNINYLNFAIIGKLIIRKLGLI